MTTIDEQKSPKPELEAALSSLANAGRIWAGHGLNVGRAALETSSRALSATAEALDHLSKSIDPERK